MDKNAHKSHHYIPQCYLKNFSENGICLFVYNKDYSKSYVQAINKTCCIKDFYTLPKIYCENQLEPLFLECEYFAKEIEPKYSVLLNKILAKEIEWMLNRSNNIKVLSSEEKFEFANYLTIQWFRMPQMRNCIKGINDDIIPKMIRLFQEGMAIENNNPDFLKLDIGYNIDPVIEHASSSFCNSDLIYAFAKALFFNSWEFFVSDSNSIYTSDYPLVVEPHVQNVVQQYQGLASYGSELSFPISKNIILTIWDNKYFKNKQQYDCRFTPLSDKGTRRYNWMRYFYAKHQIFSYNDDFTIINLAKSINGGTHLFK